MSDVTVDRLDSGAWSVAAALAIGGVGVAAGSPVLVAAATIPLWFVAAAALGSTPRTPVRLERSVTVGAPGLGDRSTRPPASGRATDGRGEDLAGEPADRVAVEVTVENASEEPIVDARIADAPPPDLPIVAGSPRTSVSVDPGGRTTFAYVLELRRGEHTFADATVQTVDLTGTVAATQTVPVAGNDRVTCTPTVERVPLGGGTNDYAGQVPTDEGGSGTEFFAVRDYEPGDPVSSIDWRRYAATRDLATVEFRAERSTRIVCVVDARPSQFLRSPDSRLPAIELSADAAERTVETLTAAGHPSGVVALSDSTVSVVSPGTDAVTRRHVASLLSGIQESSGRSRMLSWRESDPPTAELIERLPGEAQVYLFTSTVDDAPVAVVESLRARGYAVRVISPDVTRPGSDLGTRLAAIARDTRLARMRARGARVVDWQLDRPLALVLHEAVGEVAAR